MSVILGGIIGAEREMHKRSAGFRTHMFVCLGAAASMIIGQYIVDMSIYWNLAKTPDVSRISSMVINGVGFIGTGTIIINKKQQVKGLTTAASLWTCACMGIAIGSGFVSSVVIGFLFIIICLKVFAYFEDKIVDRSRNMNLYLQLSDIGKINAIADRIKKTGTIIYGYEFTDSEINIDNNTSIIMEMRLPSNISKNYLCAVINEDSNVRSMEEI